MDLSSTSEEPLGFTALRRRGKNQWLWEAHPEGQGNRLDLDSVADLARPWRQLASHLC